jgi:hypothetical protein
MAGMGSGAGREGEGNGEGIERLSDWGIRRGEEGL